MTTKQTTRNELRERLLKDLYRAQTRQSEEEREFFQYIYKEQLLQELCNEADNDKNHEKWEFERHMAEMMRQQAQDSMEFYEKEIDTYQALLEKIQKSLDD